MRVLLVSKTVPPQVECSGTAAMARVIAEGLAQRGHPVRVLSSYRAADAEANGVTVRARLIMDQPEPYKPPARWTTWDKLLWVRKARHNYRALRREMREFRPDIVYLNDTELLTGSVFGACLDAGVRCLWHAHDHLLHEALARARQAGVPTARQRRIQALAHQPGPAEYLATPLLAVSEFLAEEVRSLGWPAGLVTVVPNGLPDWFFSDAPRDPPAADNWPLLYVGRCVEDKGIFTLLQVLRRLRERGLPLKLVLVGGFPDETARSTFLAAADSAGVRDQVECRGVLPRRQLPDVYGAAGCLLAPSQCLEGFGLMSAEAQACGTPVIASRVGGLPETLEDGQTGFLCAPGDAAAMAQRVEQLHLNPGLWRQMSEAAALRARDRFSAVRMLDDLERLLTQVVATPG